MSVQPDWPASLPAATTPRWRSQLSRLRLGMEVFVWRHGQIWVVIAGMTVMAGVGYGWGLRGAESQLAQMQLRLQALGPQPRAASAPGVGAGSLQHPSQSEREFGLEQVLVDRDQLPQLVLRLQDLARQRQLAITQVTYQDVEMLGANASLQRVRMTLPLKVSYPQFRAFMEAVLLTMPNVSVDQISVKRGSAGESQAEVSLRLSVWLRGPGLREAGASIDVPERPAPVASGVGSQEPTP